MRLFSLEKKGCFIALWLLEIVVQPTFCWFTSTNEQDNITDWWMLVLYPSAAVVSRVASSCFICELFLKSIKWAFSWYSLLSVPCGNSRSNQPPCLLCLRNSNHTVSIPPMPWFPVHWTPPPSNPLPLEFQKGGCVMVWIFSGIAHYP